MDPLAGGIWALALAVVSAAILWAFKTPKEMDGEMRARVDQLEDAHHQLDVRTSITDARLTAEIRHLAQSIRELSQTIKESDGKRISGRHPRTT